MIILKRNKERVKVPRSVQQAIPIKAIYEDGIFEIGRNKYSKSFKFTDVNYAVAGQDDKEAMFLDYSSILNLLDAGSYPKLTIINRKLNKIDYDTKMRLELGNDNLSKYRKEYNEILAKNSVDSNGIIQEKAVLFLSPGKCCMKNTCTFSLIPVNFITFSAFALFFGLLACKPPGKSINL